MDVRGQTYIIIERDGEFLVGCVFGTNVLRWSQSPWDAWRTRERDNASAVAGVVHGNRMLFNPVAGQLRRMA